mmetsp:Transcript_15925/g.36737  ORF Transcript_15925/g.36737 Transcript_15925/m.36737 type:complete len:104 (+) Transcript_15925:870-1181(+)
MYVHGYRYVCVLRNKGFVGVQHRWQEASHAPFGATKILMDSFFGVEKAVPTNNRAVGAQGNSLHQQLTLRRIECSSFWIRLRIYIAAMKCQAIVDNTHSISSF